MDVSWGTVLVPIIMSTYNAFDLTYSKNLEPLDLLVYLWNFRY